jgi:hypothetical protein
VTYDLLRRAEGEVEGRCDAPEEGYRGWGGWIEIDLRADFVSLMR